VFDVEDAGEQAYVVLEWVAGESLLDMLANGPLDAPVAVSLLREAAQAIAAAHRGGLSHLRLTPACLHWTRGSGVKITGLGIDAVLAGLTPAADGAGAASIRRAFRATGRIGGRLSECRANSGNIDSLRGGSIAEASRRGPGKWRHGQRARTVTGRCAARPEKRGSAGGNGDDLRVDPEFRTFSRYLAQSPADRSVRWTSLRIGGHEIKNRRPGSSGSGYQFSA